MDKKVWIGACVAVALAGATAAAQTSTATSGQTSSSDRPVTVTGCLQKGDQSGSSTAATTGSSSTKGSEFILANAKMGSGTGSTSGTTGTTGGTTAGGTTTGGATTGSESSRTSGNKYELEGSESQLSPHVGHEIEVTGTIDRSASSSGSSTPSTTGGTTSSTSRTGSMGANQLLKVTSVRMISSTCSRE
jgi:hypothetical protein